MITPHLGLVLGVFLYQMAQQLTVQLLQRRADRKWEYTTTVTARAEAGFDMMEVYIRQSQNMVAQYIAVQLLLNLCEATERMQGARVGMR